MKKTLWIPFLLLIFISCSDKKEKKEIDEVAAIVFKSIVDKDFETFKNHSTEKIYCIICFSKPDFNKKEPYLLDRNRFFKNYINDIRNSNAFTKAVKNKNIRLVKEENSNSKITAYYRIDDNHELGLYFKNNNGEFKFSGIEIIP